MSAARQKSAGLTAQVINFPINPGVNPAVNPGVISRGRIVLERPNPQAVRRICVYCSAIFDDFTQRSNTLYCHPSCRVMMSRFKKRSAIDLLATLTHAPVTAVAISVEARPLADTEKLLLQFGYTFDISAKSWIKKGQS